MQGNVVTEMAAYNLHELIVFPEASQCLLVACLCVVWGCLIVCAGPCQWLCSVLEATLCIQSTLLRCSHTYLCVCDVVCWSLLMLCSVVFSEPLAPPSTNYQD